ncbi:unnamed protein product [Darwinula stevensoni]|uniref:General transcription factor IIF subunit 2 n=1 Tax=Darwinula stevensoni TaxID=69355 RepID=A0A7R9AAJ2_9CRUS|nr:unnamed protein product [Darwinula stevensoni]CAG0898093.1 unnamed protein product [Darwinula stevensoni]
MPGERDMDCTNAARGVWLVKVPKYLSNIWDKSPSDMQVGKMQITKTPGTKPNVTFSLNPEAAKFAKNEKTVTDYKLAISSVSAQSLVVFSQTVPNQSSDSVIPETSKLSLEGRVVQRTEFRPVGDVTYMNLKKEQILKAAQPTRMVQQLDKIVNNYKPVADHKHNVDYQKQKKAEGKKMREGKEKVMDMLFQAFEKHQYYNIKDLVGITQQPVAYLKEILKDVCNYSHKNPHKNMWELKPEYRHYNKESE